MTFKELYQYKDLIQEICDEEKRLRDLDDQLTALKSPSMEFSGLSSVSISTRREYLIDKIDSIKKVIEERKARCEEERLKIEKFIAGIEDSYTRRIFTYRFIEHYSWNKVAMKVSGGISSGNTMIQICKRYLEK